MRTLGLWLPGATLAVGAAALYVRTLAPGLTYGDGGDLTVAAYQLGVPHPPGYPLYTLLGHVWLSLVPVKDAAWRMNLFSAVCACLAVAAIYFAVTLAVGTAWRGAFLGAGLFAVSPTFWSQAVVAEVYTFHILLTALLLALMAVHVQRPSPRSEMALVALAAIMLTHHLMSLWLLPAVAYALFAMRHRLAYTRRALRLTGCFLVPLVLYAYLPWAAHRDPDWNWGDARTSERFMAHVTARLYREDMAYFRWVPAGRRLKSYLGLGSGSEFAATTQFPFGLLALAPVGLVWLFKRHHHVGVATLLCYLGPLVWALMYSIRDIDSYFLPSHLMTALWIGVGFEALTSAALTVTKSIGARRGVLAVVASLALFPPAVLAAGRFGSMDRSRDRGAQLVASAVLSAVKPNAVVVLSGDAWAFPVAYEHYVLKRRPDVVLLLYRDFMNPMYVRLIVRERRRGLIVPPPAGKGFNSEQRLLALLDANLTRRPCYVVGSVFDTHPPSLRALPAKLRMRRLAQGLPVFEVLPMESHP